MPYSQRSIQHRLNDLVDDAAKTVIRDGVERAEVTDEICGVTVTVTVAGIRHRINKIYYTISFTVRDGGSNCFVINNMDEAGRKIVQLRAASL